MAWVIQQLREAMPFGLPNDRKIKGRQLIGTITGTTVKGTASSGGRLASETPCDARFAGLHSLGSCYHLERPPNNQPPLRFFGWTVYRRLLKMALEELRWI